MVDLSAEALLEYDQIVNSTFNSEGHGFDFYNSYALKKGFSVKRCYSEKDKATNKIKLRKFVCSRQGFRDQKHMKKESKKRKARNMTRCRCLAKSTPYTELDAGIEKDAAHVFTSAVFDLVKVNIDSVTNFVISEILDGCDLTTYIVAMKEKRERKFQVVCEFSEASLKDISCSCHKLECDGIPCGHIFYVLQLLRAEKLPKCCVAIRWTMGAKAAFPPVRKSSMYDHSQSLDRFRELRNLSHEACLKASQSDASYLNMKHVLNGMVGNIDEANNQNPHVRYSSVLPKIVQVDSHSLDKVLDPLHVKSRGAPKKKQRIKGFMDKPTKRTCRCCKKKGHDRRTCSKYKELLGARR